MGYVRRTALCLAALGWASAATGNALDDATGQWRIKTETAVSISGTETHYTRYEGVLSLGNDGSCDLYMVKIVDRRIATNYDQRSTILENPCRLIDLGRSIQVRTQRDDAQSTATDFDLTVAGDGILRGRLFAESVLTAELHRVGSATGDHMRSVDPSRRAVISAAMTDAGFTLERTEKPTDLIIGRKLLGSSADTELTMQIRSAGDGYFASDPYRFLDQLYAVNCQTGSVALQGVTRISEDGRMLADPNPADTPPDPTGADDIAFEACILSPDRAWPAFRADAGESEVTRRGYTIYRTARNGAIFGVKPAGRAGNWVQINILRLGEFTSRGRPARYLEASYNYNCASRELRHLKSAHFNRSNAHIRDVFTFDLSGHRRNDPYPVGEIGELAEANDSFHAQIKPTVCTG